MGDKAFQVFHTMNCNLKQTLIAFSLIAKMPGRFATIFFIARACELVDTLFTSIQKDVQLYKCSNHSFLFDSIMK